MQRSSILNALVECRYQRVAASPLQQLQQPNAGDSRLQHGEYINNGQRVVLVSTANGHWQSVNGVLNVVDHQQQQQQQQQQQAGMTVLVPISLASPCQLNISSNSINNLDSFSIDGTVATESSPPPPLPSDGSIKCKNGGSSSSSREGGCDSLSNSWPRILCPALSPVSKISRVSLLSPQ